MGRTSKNEYLRAIWDRYQRAGVKPEVGCGLLLALDVLGRVCVLAGMPRTMRVEYPVAIYHVMDRGDRREDIFVNDVDRQDFLKTLAEACQKTGWQVHAYCLMCNPLDRKIKR